MRALIVLSIVALISVLTAGCGSAPSQATEPTAGPTSQPRPDLSSLIRGPISPDGLQAILGTADLAVGERRVAFALSSEEALVRAPVATVSSLHFPTEDSEGEVRQTVPAFFQEWPGGSRGIYTTRLNFDEAGRWGIKVSVLDSQGNSQQASLSFEVAEDTQAPDVGEQAVPSDNKTLSDVASIDQLTTGSLHDPELYQTTIANAIESDLPTVVVMTSPAFCTNAVCGPQDEVLHRLKNAYEGQAHFIHVDFYDNPTEIQGDLDRAVLSPAVVDWNLPSGEWSFVIDRDGTIAARFEGFASFDELEQALTEVI